jgi:hypothetical protein
MERNWNGGTSLRNATTESMTIDSEDDAKAPDLTATVTTPDGRWEKSGSQKRRTALDLGKLDLSSTTSAGTISTARVRP